MHFRQNASKKSGENEIIRFFVPDPLDPGQPGILQLLKKDAVFFAVFLDKSLSVCYFTEIEMIFSILCGFMRDSPS